MKPERWVESLCAAVQGWADDLAAARERADLDATDRTERKRALVAYLGDATDATRVVVRRLRTAGVPDVPDGEQVAATFRRALRQARASFATALADARELPPRKAKRYDREVAEISESVTEAAAGVGQTFARADERYDEEALDTAFAEVPACSGLL